MNAPACPRCGGPAAWKAQANGWGCDRCQQMLPALQPAGAPPMQAAPTQAPATCPQCGGPGVWHGQVGRWGCDRCRGYLDQMRPSAAAAQDAEKAAKRARGAKMMLLGGGLCIFGIIITVATQNAAEENGGGTYIIAYGPMIVGGIRFFQGLFMMA